MQYRIFDDLLYFFYPFAYELLPFTEKIHGFMSFHRKSGITITKGSLLRIIKIALHKSDYLMKKNFLTLLLLFPIYFLSAQEKEVKEMDLRLNRYQYPYEVDYFILKQQDQRLEMAYMDVESKNPNGKNIMLLHGKNFNGAYWKTTIDSLSKKGFRVIVPDQIGFGKSSKPSNFQYSFHQLAHNTKLLLEDLGVEKAIVLGHSMGGMLATRFALMYPETTDRLILENPIGLEDYKLKVPYKTVDWWYENEKKKDYESIKAYQLENYYDGKWKYDYNEWIDILAGWTLSQYYPSIAWNAALTYDMILTQPVVYELSEIEVPTLLIIGTRDRTALGKKMVSEEVRATMGLYHQLGEKTKKAIPKAELVELNDIGHLPHIEDFDRFISTLTNYLDKTPKGKKKPKMTKVEKMKKEKGETKKEK